MSLLLASLLLLQGLEIYAQSRPISIRSTGNPILPDGSYFSADPGPLAVNNTLYILAGHGDALQNDNSFIINDW